MSILIKGIDLPHEEINLTITKDGRIYLDNKYHLIAEAIQIPTPHGRLIEEHYDGELKAKRAEGVFIIYRSADEDNDRFILEAEE